MNLKEKTWWPGLKLAGNIIFYAAFAIVLIWKIKAMIPEKSVYRPAPDFQSEDMLSGTHFRLSDFKGKVVVLNYWATWCPPCRKEIPDLIRLQEKYSGQVQVIGVSLDRDGVEGVIKFAQDRKISYPIVMPSDPALYQMGTVKSLPTTFIIDQAGNIKKVMVGVRTFMFFEAAVKQLLKTP